MVDMNRGRARRRGRALGVAASVLALAALGSVASVAMLQCGGAQFQDASSSNVDGGDSQATGDGTTSLDGSPPVPGFCASQMPAHFFCADWDELDLKRGWDTTSTSRYGDIALDTSIALSGARSYRAQTTHSFSGEETRGLLQKDLGHAKSLQVKVSVYIDSYGSDANAMPSQFNALAIIAFGSTSFSLVALTPQTAALLQSAGADAGEMAAALPGITPGQWVAVEIDVSLPEGAGVGMGQVSFDGKLVFNGPFTVPITATDASLSLGVFLLNAPNLWKIHYDNLTVDKT